MIKFIFNATTTIDIHDCTIPADTIVNEDVEALEKENAQLLFEMKTGEAY